MIENFHMSLSFRVEGDSRHSAARMHEQANRVP